MCTAEFISTMVHQGSTDKAFFFRMDTAVYSAVQPSNAEGALMLRLLTAVGGKHDAEDANTSNAQVVTQPSSHGYEFHCVHNLSVLQNFISPATPTKQSEGSWRLYT